MVARTYVSALLSLVVMAASSGCSPTPATPDPLPLMVEQISLARSAAERDALAIKRNYANGQLCAVPSASPAAQTIMRNAETRYNQAADAFNAWIDGYLFGLILNEPLGPGSASGTHLQAAVDSGNSFHLWANSEEGCGIGGARGGPGARTETVLKVVSELVPVLTNAGVDVAKAYRQAAQERRKEIGDRLREQKWTAFASLA